MGWISVLGSIHVGNYGKDLGKAHLLGGRREKGGIEHLLKAAFD